MHLLEKIQRNVFSVATSSPPMGPGFEPHLAALASVMEVWATGIHDKDEYCEFILKDVEGKVIGTRRIDGY